ncbi:hypothetical protein [Streptomyces sp. NPDC029003]|uniref:hypothetical protein n=1 Tax=Streptomyces sp. NPDC029003 TaxID=3155125 RepID=UPI0033FDCD41
MYEDDADIPFERLPPERQAAQREAWARADVYTMSTEELAQAHRALTASPVAEHRARAAELAYELDVRLGNIEPDFYGE